jgi:tetratricopeptide (TPR) repeat protein
MKPLKAPMGFICRIVSAVVFCSMCAGVVSAQQTPILSLDNNLSLTVVLAGMNACGYNDELDQSAPLRTLIRNEIAEAVSKSPEAQESLARWCRFYIDHQQADPARQLSQYVSLALNLNEPPDLTPKVREADLPPDSVFVLGAVPLLKNLYATTGMSKILQEHAADFNGLIQTYHDPVANLIFATNIYLKEQMSSYVGRRFVIYIDPMNPPGQVNSRNYGDDYYMVVSPGPNGLKMDQIRHTYLHYIIDPMALKRANTIARMSPILKTVQSAPMDSGYKNEISLMVTECIIRAIEARMTGGSKGPAAAKEAAVDHSMREGFVLTRYFYEQLIAFEQSPAGLKDSFGDWLYNLYLPKEIKRAEQLTWVKDTSPEVLRRSVRQQSLMEQAERQLAAGNILGAEKLAQESRDAHEEPGPALFLLARAATQRGDMQGAKMYFERTLEESKDPKLLAWSHIYLGRILDLTDDRQDAIKHYMAALNSGDTTPATKAAAERGIKEQFEAPRKKD